MSKYPSIKTELPGPKSRALIERDERYVSHSYTRAYPTVIDRAEGALIWDVDGNCFLDFHSGIGVCSTGSCHPKVVEAIRKQLEKAVHIASADFYHERVGQLAEKMSEIAPGDSDKRTFFTNSGTEAVETAFKLARYNKKKPRMIAFFGAFHGRTMGALSLTNSKATQRRYFAPLVPEVTHVPFGYCYRCPLNLKYPSCNVACVDYIEGEVFTHVAPPEEVAAIFVEPIQGEGGYIVPPPLWLPKLKALAEKYNILLVADEVQSGMGKTGKMFAVEHWGVEPDIIAAAKALASGMPLGACIARSDLMTWERGAHSTTFGGSPVACAAALVTIDLLQTGLMENAQRLGALILERLYEMQKEHWSMGDVRGKGLMIGTEFVYDRETKKPAGELAEAIQMECFRNGLMLLTAGPSSIRFVPPLVIDQPMVEKALEIFEAAVTKVESRKQSAVLV